MSYAVIDDKILTCPKALEAGEEATNLFLRMVIWCNCHLTDGRIPKSALNSISIRKNRGRMSEELVRVGWLKEEPESWQIVGYLDDYKSRAQIEKERELARNRAAKSRARGAAHVQNTCGERTADVREKCGALSPPLPLTPPDPDVGEGKGVRGKGAPPPPADAGPPLADPAPVPEPPDPGPPEPDPKPPSGRPAAPDERTVDPTEERSVPPDERPAVQQPELPVAVRTPKRRRERGRREPSPAALRVLEAIHEETGVQYPPATADALEARLRGEEPALDEDQALALVRWAARDRFWGGEVRLRPDTLFRPRHVPGLLAQAQAKQRRSAPAEPAPPPAPPPRLPVDDRSVWGQALSRLRDGVPDYALDSWFTKARQVGLDGDRLTLGVPDLFVRDWILDHYGDKVRRTLAEVAGHPVEIVFQVGSGANSPAALRVVEGAA